MIVPAGVRHRLSRGVRDRTFLCGAVDCAQRRVLTRRTGHRPRDPQRDCRAAIAFKCAIADQSVLRIQLCAGSGARVCIDRQRRGRAAESGVGEHEPVSMPPIEVVGVYPTLETLVTQSLILGIMAISVAYNLRAKQ